MHELALTGLDFGFLYEIQGLIGRTQRLMIAAPISLSLLYVFRAFLAMIFTQIVGRTGGKVVNVLFSVVGFVVVLKLKGDVGSILMMMDQILDGIGGFGSGKGFQFGTKVGYYN